jgi:type VI secretion system secreted protein VgrG
MGFLSRSKDGTPDNANALRFEDKAGEEQVWIQAQKNMDTNIKNDETHTVGGNQTVSVNKDFTSTVSGAYVQKTQKSRNELVGGDYELWAQDGLQIAAGQGISFVSGESVLTLDPNGTISLQCIQFQINATGNGQINTGGTLDLNISTPTPGITPDPTPMTIGYEVLQAFDKKGSNS